MILEIIFSMTPILQRIKDYADSKKLSIREIETAIDASNGTLGKALRNGTDIGASWLEKIVSAYPDLNPAWLLTGRGNMIMEIAGNIAPMVAANGQEQTGMEDRIQGLDGRLKSLEHTMKELLEQLKRG